jgi:hypothetical protein
LFDRVCISSCGTPSSVGIKRWVKEVSMEIESSYLDSYVGE